MMQFMDRFPPNTHPQAILTAIAQQYDLKGIFYLDFWPLADSFCVLSDPDLLEQVMVSRSLPIHRASEAFISPIIGKNVLVASNGAYWKEWHRKIAPAFSWSNIRRMSKCIIDECMIFRNALDRLADAGETFSMREKSEEVVFDLIGQAVFGLSLHAQKREVSYLTDLQDMLRLTFTQRTWNLWVKLMATIEKRSVFNRLEKAFLGKIDERLKLLVQEKNFSSKKDPTCLMNLMLREFVEGNDYSKRVSSSKDICPNYLESMMTK
jgi:cytochrome P450